MPDRHELIVVGFAFVLGICLSSAPDTPSPIGLTWRQIFATAFFVLVCTVFVHGVTRKPKRGPEPVHNTRNTDIYAQFADAIQAQAESKLGRHLTVREANGIRNAGSLMSLELVDMGIQYAETTEEVVARLESSAEFTGNFETIVEMVRDALEDKLGRTLTDDEIGRLTTIPNALECMHLLDTLAPLTTIGSLDEVNTLGSSDSHG